MNKWLNASMNEWWNECKREWMNDWMNDWWKASMNAWMNEWMNQPMRRVLQAVVAGRRSGQARHTTTKPHYQAEPGFDMGYPAEIGYQVLSHTHVGCCS